MNRFLVTVLFFWQTVFLVGQTNKGITDSVFQIREVTVSSNRLEYFSIGNKMRTLDSSLMGSCSTANLAQVLGSYSQVQINSYGLGLSNPSVRGTGSSHTAVLWNGFNLQDLLNGGVDCSLIPINFIDDIKVQYGGCSALFGSGAIGGVIHLNNSVDFNKGFSSKIVAGYGSYDNAYGGLNLNYSNNSYSGSIRGFYTTAQNNFQFRNETRFNSPLETQKNAEKKQYGILASNAFKLGENNKIESFFWYQDNDKNIAPSMLQTTSKDNQADRFYRSTASWKTWGAQSDFTLRCSLSDYFMTYNLLDKYQSIQTSTEAEYNLKLTPNHLFNAGADYTYEKGISEHLISNAYRNRVSLFTSYRFTDNKSKWNVVANFRDELINQSLTPLTFSVGFDHNITSSLQVKGVLSKNYRVPSFDDLYWTPGGNPNLKNESGWNQELGFILSKKVDIVGFRYEITGFSNLISDWIIWQPPLPTDTFSYWRPENVSKVWARGIENDLSISFPWNNILVKTMLSYSYIKSTKVKSDFSGDDAFHKQLIYVPEHKGLLSLSLLYKGYSLYYSQSYVGLRYTAKDNTQSVDPYTIGNVSLSKNIRYRNHQLNIGFQVNNVWNSVYQVMVWYPMPLRNFQLNIQFNLK